MNALTNEQFDWQKFVETAEVIISFSNHKLFWEVKEFIYDGIHICWAKHKHPNTLEGQAETRVLYCTGAFKWTMQTPEDNKLIDLFCRSNVHIGCIVDAMTAGMNSVLHNEESEYVPPCEPGAKVSPKLLVEAFYRGKAIAMVELTRLKEIQEKNEQSLKTS